MPEVTWSEEWPTEPGFYWLFGHRFRDEDRPPEMYTVQVRPAREGVVYVCGGAFLYKGEGARGVWTPAIVPDPPA